MVRQEVYRDAERIYDRIISDKVFANMLGQIYILRESGEEIEFSRCHDENYHTTGYTMLRGGCFTRFTWIDNEYRLDGKDVEDAIFVYA